MNDINKIAITWKREFKVNLNLLFTNVLLFASPIEDFMISNQQPAQDRFISVPVV